MKNKSINTLGLLAVILIILVVLAVSYFVTVGTVWLIALCFNLKFSWIVATGIWLALSLLSLFFGGSNK